MNNAFHLPKRLATVGAVGLLAAGGAGVALSTTAHGATAPAEKVTMSGTDAGNCVKTPCATINYAIAQAAYGEAINVAAGTYHQTVDVDKTVRILGAGSTKTTIDGTGLDPSTGDTPDYGTVFVGNAAGAVTVSGLTIENPAPESYTGGEPMDVVLQDPNSGAQVSIINDNLQEGTSDQNAGTDFPIGVYTQDNAAQTTISGDTINGFFQGSLLEDQSGPVTVSGDKFQNLISGNDGTTTYPAEGLFFLADAGGDYTNQNATNNSFSGYSGDGILADAGYTGGYVTPDCVANGSIGATLTGNTFALTGNSPGTGIRLAANGTGNDLTATVNGNRGYVTAPANGMETLSVATPATPAGQSCGGYSDSNGGGGTLDVTENNNNIAQRAASTPSPSTAKVQSAGVGRVHVPHLAK